MNSRIVAQDIINNDNTSVSIESLGAGIYTVQLFDTDGVYGIRKLIKN